MNLGIYNPEIECETSSMLSGKHAEKVRFDQLPKFGVIQAWLDDDELQYLEIASTNIGFIRRFSKRYVK